MEHGVLCTVYDVKECGLPCMQNAVLHVVLAITRLSLSFQHSHFNILLPRLLNEVL